jgi:hypothetical protein
LIIRARGCSATSGDRKFLQTLGARSIMNTELSNQSNGLNCGHDGAKNMPNSVPHDLADKIANNVANAAKHCAAAECGELSAATLDNECLCLEHFFARCYAGLECYDGRRDHTRGVHETERAALRRFLEECSAQALNLGLRNENLNNQQRSRLLDVLLWAGELSECVSASQMKFGGMEQRSLRGKASGEVPTGF